MALGFQGNHFWFLDPRRVPVFRPVSEKGGSFLKDPESHTGRSRHPVAITALALVTLFTLAGLVYQVPAVQQTVDSPWEVIVLLLKVALLPVVVIFRLLIFICVLGFLVFFGMALVEAETPPVELVHGDDLA